MKWTTVSNHASVDTFIENKDGITFDTYKALQDRGLTAKILYPTGEETNLPFGNPIRDMVLGLRAQRHASLNSVSEVPITVEAEFKDIDEVLEIIHTGAPIKKKILNPATKTKTEDPQNAKIISDSTAPVTSSGEKEADRRRIRRSEEDANGIRRTEEIVEETSDSVSPYSDMSSEEPEEETEEQTEEEYAVASVNAEKKILAAFSLADELVEIGALDPRNRLAFVSQLEKETTEQIEARKATAELLKQTRKNLPKTASRLPKFTSFNIEANENPVDDIDDLTFDAIFLG